MGRPNIKPEKKRRQLSVSLKPAVYELTKRAENSSMFVEDSVEGMRGLCSVLDKLHSKEWDIERCIEELEDIAGVWESSFDETVEAEEPLQKSSVF